MFLDLDGFKSINDSLGHTSGDKLLQLVASRLVSCVRRSDTVSRLGGGEFVVLLYQVEHAEDAAFISKKILSSLAEPFFVEHKHLDISARGRAGRGDPATKSRHCYVCGQETRTQQLPIF
jgi:diguanylate cyclase (GGDEF)-like protein